MRVHMRVASEPSKLKWQRQSWNNCFVYVLPRALVNERSAFVFICRSSDEYNCTFRSSFFFQMTTMTTTTTLCEYASAYGDWQLVVTAYDTRSFQCSLGFRHVCRVCVWWVCVNSEYVLRVCRAFLSTAAINALRKRGEEDEEERGRAREKIENKRLLRLRCMCIVHCAVCAPRSAYISSIGALLICFQFVLRLFHCCITLWWYLSCARCASAENTRKRKKEKTSISFGCCCFENREEIFLFYRSRYLFRWNNE